MPDDRQVQTRRPPGLRSTSPVPFAIAISSLGLSASAVTEVDVFIMVPHDSGIDAGFFIFDAASALRGVMQLSLVQDLGDGTIRAVTEPVTVSRPSTEPVELEVQSGDLAYGRPVYLRIKSSPSGGGTPWWASAVTRINGTLHMQNEV